MAPKNPSVNCFRKFKRLQLTFQVVYRAPCGSDRGVRRSPEQVPCVPPTDRIAGREVMGNMRDYAAHMSNIQAKYFNRDEEEKSGTKM
jgi:hypothetical protein